MTFKQNLARIVAGDITIRGIPSIALSALEEGLDSPFLRILAGLADNENGYIIDQYFKAALKELSFELPDKRKAAIEVGLAIADEIFEGRRKVFEGVREIKTRAIDTYPFYEESKDYCYDSISFEKVYGLFDSIDELRNETVKWQEEKTKDLEELTTKLMNELKVWSLKSKTGK